MIKHVCNNCLFEMNSPDKLAGKKTICPCCEEETIVPYDEIDYLDNDYNDDNDELLCTSGKQENNYETEKHHRKTGWLKSFVAIFIGIVAGLFLRLVIGIPLVIIFGTEEGLPLDITFVLEVFTAFVAGAMAGSLVPRLGWLIGGLTQFMKIIITLVVFGLWTFFLVTDPEVKEILNFIREPSFRLIIIAIVIAGAAGIIGQKFRKNIWSFLGACFGFIAGIFVITIQVLGGVIYLYFLYRGGKLLFEEGRVFGAMVWILVIGPAVSFGISFLFLFVGMFGGWIFKKIYNWWRILI